MSKDVELERAFSEVVSGMTPDITDMLRKAFMAGFEIGQSRRNGDIIEKAKAVMLAAGAPLELASSPKERQRPTQARANGGYSGVAEAVRRTLHEIGRVPAGIDVPKMQKHIRGKLDRPDIATQQIRSALKQLLDHGEASRLERGYYKAGPNLAVPMPNGTVSTLFAGATA